MAGDVTAGGCTPGRLSPRLAASLAGRLVCRQAGWQAGRQAGGQAGAGWAGGGTLRGGREARAGGSGSADLGGFSSRGPSSVVSSTPLRYFPGPLRALRPGLPMAVPAPRFAASRLAGTRLVAGECTRAPFDTRRAAPAVSFPAPAAQQALGLSPGGQRHSRGYAGYRWTGLPRPDTPVVVASACRWTGPARAATPVAGGTAPLAARPCHSSASGAAALAGRGRGAVNCQSPAGPHQHHPHRPLLGRGGGVSCVLKCMRQRVP